MGWFNHQLVHFFGSMVRFEDFKLVSVLELQFQSGNLILTERYYPNLTCSILKGLVMLALPSQHIIHMSNEPKPGCLVYMGDYTIMK